MKTWESLSQLIFIYLRVRTPYLDIIYMSPHQFSACLHTLAHTQQGETSEYTQDKACSRSRTRIYDNILGSVQYF